MKILLVHNHYQFRGGEDRYVEIQVELLRARGHEVMLYLRDSRDLEDASAQEKLHAAWQVPNSRATYEEISDLVSRERPDIAHVHNVFPLISPSAIRALSDAGVPVVLTHHNYRLVCPNGLLYTRGAVCERCTRGSFLPAVAHRCIQNSLAPSFLYAATLALHRSIGTYARKVDLHLCPSEALRRRIAAALPTECRVDVFPSFLPDHPPCLRMSTRPYLVYLGRLSREKGPEVLLEAARMLPDTDVEFLGEGPLRLGLEDSLDSELRKRVRFRGAILDDRRFEILEGSLALVAPSVCPENLPFAILESLRAGVPVVASGGGSLEEVIQEGTNGIHFRSGDASDLARAVRHLQNMPVLRSHLREGARNSYLEHYTVEKGYQRLMRCYDSLVLQRECGGAHN